MPKVAQAHLDARRQQIIDAARVRFTKGGFARTSLTDIVEESGLSNGAIYRYFGSKEEIVAAVCEQASDALPTALSPAAISDFLEHIRALARDSGHARLVTQIMGEAAVSPALARIVQAQLARLRVAVADLLPARRDDAEQVAEAFVAVCSAYNTQLAVRGDVDPAPYTRALTLILRQQSRPARSAR